MKYNFLILPSVLLSNLHKGTNMIKANISILFIIFMLCMSIQIVQASSMPNKTITITLMKMESPAEDMLDAIDSKNMKQLHLIFEKLKGYVIKANNLNANDTVQYKQLALLYSWFDLIALEIKEADDLPALANAINQFSGQLILTTGYKHKYQKDIAWMDYLGRELLLLNKYPSESIYHDNLIKIRKAELQTTWNHIKKIASIKKGGNSIIQNVEPTIQSILHESDRKAIVSLSKKELDLVDDIETFFGIN